MTRRRANTDQLIQRAGCQHLRTRGAAGLIWWHDGQRNPCTFPNSRPMAAPPGA
jgi:hypothetical protein